MNDISVILQKIEEDAKVQAAAIIDAAKESCLKIQADYDKEAHKQEQEILAAGKAAADAVLLRGASQSGIEERNLKLTTRRKAMDAAFEKSMERLCAMSDEKKVALYSQMALSSMAGHTQLILNATERASIGKAVCDLVNKKMLVGGVKTVVEAITNLELPEGKLMSLTLADEVGPFRGGMKLRCGNIETNCTFEVLLDRAKEELEPEVARILFE